MTDYADEIAHWDRCLAQGNAPALDPRLRAGIFPVPLIPCVRAFWGAHGTAPRVLDVGAGPLSQLAWGAEDGIIRLDAVDPLAKAYARLLEKHGLTYPVCPIEGVGEELDRLFEPGTFDVVFSNNALDHASSPARCMAQMTAVLAPGGVLVVVSRLREGTSEKWHGLHQHDLVPVEGRLWRYGQGGEGSDLVEGLDLRCICQLVTGHRVGDEFTMVYRRGPDADSGAGAREAWPDLAWSIPFLMKRFNAEAVTRTDPARRAQAFPKEILEGRTAVRSVFHPGSGPFSRLAFGVEERRIEVAAVDLLAPLYVELIERWHCEYPIRPASGSSDRAVEAFGAAAFDAVYVDSGLDDARVFEAGLRSLSRVLKPGGRLLLSGLLEEKTWHGWAGSPLRDVAIENGLAVLRGGEKPPASLDSMTDLRTVEVRAPKNLPGETYTIILERPSRRASGARARPPARSR